MEDQEVDPYVVEDLEHFVQEVEHLVQKDSDRCHPLRNQ